MDLYKQLYNNIGYLTKDEIEQVYQAFLLASSAHVGQKRDDGEDFLTHPVAVAILLAQMHMDYQCIIAALLHDVIEDTSISKDEIKAKFGEAVANLVDGVTKLTQIEASTKAEAQAESFRKMVLAMSRDIRVILIKLADRLHNMRTIFGVAAHKRKRIAHETLDIYAPIANRLGMHNIYIELENLSFMALYPRRYRVLKQAVELARGNRKEVMKTIEKELRDTIEKSSLEHPVLIGREKHLYGIYKKMLRQGASFSEIMDVYAFRVVVKNVEDCYRALGIVHGLYKPIPGKFKDYIAIPKYNGYQSLHTTLIGPYGVPIEVQVRTALMEQMANSGIAAHWLYKSGDKLSDTAHIRAQRWINNLLDMQQATGNSLEFFENVKLDLFPEEVYVFTPKGNIMELPRGATVVDFAYAVHTDIGNSCVAARIDRQFMPLSTVLTTGQTVSIITNEKAKPNPIWLNFVVSAKARSKIRNFLKYQRRSDAVALGKQLLTKALSDVELDFHSVSTNIWQELQKESNFKTLDDLYEDIGLGNRLGVIVAHQLATKIDADRVSGISPQEVKPLLIHGAEGMSITFAQCCCPIPGDPIVGCINAGHGLDIHTGDCANLAKYRKQPEKCLPVSWADDVQGDFRVNLHVEVKNQRGALAALCKAVSEANVSIDDIAMDDRNADYCSVSMRLLVKNISHLERVFRHIKNVPLVIVVVRKK